MLFTSSCRKSFSSAFSGAVPVSFICSCPPDCSFTGVWSPPSPPSAKNCRFNGKNLNGENLFSIIKNPPFWVFPLVFLRLTSKRQASSLTTYSGQVANVCYQRDADHLHIYHV